MLRPEEASKRRQPQVFQAEISSLTSFLSESRLEIESSHNVCSNPGCAFLQTGLVDAFCCRVCKTKPGLHGPHCRKRLLRCRSPGCAFAVTGVAFGHCCRLCARDGSHGPHCQQLTAASVVDGGDDDHDDDDDDDDDDEDDHRHQHHRHQGGGDYDSGSGGGRIEEGGSGSNKACGGGSSSGGVDEGAGGDGGQAGAEGENLGGMVGLEGMPQGALEVEFDADEDAHLVQILDEQITGNDDLIAEGEAQITRLLEELQRLEDAV